MSCPFDVRQKRELLSNVDSEFELRKEGYSCGNVTLTGQDQKVGNNEDTMSWSLF